MLSLALPGRVFLCTLPTDMRKSFDTLSGLVQQYLDQDPLSGDLFVFRSKRGDRVKLLYWDNDGLAIWYKRLEEGTFTLPKAGGQRTEVGAHGLLLERAGVGDAARWRRSGQRQATETLPAATSGGSAKRSVTTACQSHRIILLFFDNFLQQIASVLVYKNMMSTDVPVVTVTATTSQGVPPLPDDPAVLKRMIVELLAALLRSICPART